MTRRRDLDPFELIADANPIGAESVPGSDSEVVRRVFEDVTSRVAHSRRVRRRVQIVGLAILALAAIAAGVYLSRPPSQLNGVSCYSAAALDADFFVTLSADGGPGTVDDCVPLWLDGSLTNDAIDVPEEASDLTGCVSEVGQLLVFPSRDDGLCNRFGLAVAEKPTGVEEQIKISNGLVDFFGGAGCITMEDAESKVREILLSSSEGDLWNLEVDDPTEEWPCASYSLDAEKRRIVLVPIPRSPND